MLFSPFYTYHLATHASNLSVQLFSTLSIGGRAPEEFDTCSVVLEYLRLRGLMYCLRSSVMMTITRRVV